MTTFFTNKGFTFVTNYGIMVPIKIKKELTVFLDTVNIIAVTIVIKEKK